MRLRRNPNAAAAPSAGSMGRIGARALRPLALAFLLLTAAVFLAPPSLLAAPNAPASGGVFLVAVISGALVAVQVAGLAVAGSSLLPEGRVVWQRSVLLLVAADIVAVSNATRLALGVRFGGAAGDIAEALLFALPLALWAAFAWPALRSVPVWWGGPLRLTTAVFPVSFLLAALSRIDFYPYTGASTPAPILWLFAYGPTVLMAAIALVGWLAFEDARSASRQALARSVTPVLAVGIAAGVLVASTRDFIVSATITWGAGYQLFSLDVPPGPLAVSLALVGTAFAGDVAAGLKIRREGRPVTPLLLLTAAVLSGVFSNPVSVLGSLLGLQLALVHLTGRAAGAAVPPSSASDAPRGTRGAG